MDEGARGYKFSTNHETMNTITAYTTQSQNSKSGGVAPAQSPVNSALTSIDSTAKDLRGLVNTLFDRLQPILAAAPTGNECSGLPSTGVPVVDSITSVDAHFKESGALLVHILNQLAL